jgi:hypothetical protein
MARKHEIIDDDGNALPPPAPDTDVALIIYLLEYGRKRGFRIGPTLKVGETVLQVADLRQAQQSASEGSVPDIEPGSDMATLLGGD